MRWRHCFEGLSLDGGQADFSKKPPSLKGPKHDQVECRFFTQIRPVWLGDLGTGLISLMIGAKIRHIVILANAEHTLNIM